MSDRWRVRPGSRVHLDRVNPASTAGAPGDRIATESTVTALHTELLGLQQRLWAENRRSLLVVLQALDTGGKDGTIMHVFGGVNPQATRVTAFKQPTDAELAHDFLWRVHRATPAAGEIGVFNRSHYEDVLAARIHGVVTAEICRQRYGDINAFEALLARGGTAIVKFFLHISKDEQKRRLIERLADPEKRWKFRPADLAERRHWDEYQAAYAETIERTSTDVAPWYIVPSDHKWFRNWVVSTIMIGVLRAMDPRYPDEPDLAGVVIDS